MSGETARTRLTLAEPDDRLARLRQRGAALLIYPVLALFSFPTFGLLLYGRAGAAYAHDVFDIARSGVGPEWVAQGFPLWNVHATAGNALLAQQAIGPLAIDVPIALAIGPFGAFLVGSWLLASVAGVAMHLFLRDVLGLSAVAVVGGAIVYLFAFWHPIIGFVAPALPLLLWLLERSIRTRPGRWRFVAARVALGAFVLYNGQLQLVLLAAGLELGWTVAVYWRDHADMRRALVVWAGGWALAFAVYAPVLATQLVMLPLSHRTEWNLSSFAPDDPVFDTVRFYSQLVLGVPTADGWGASPAVYGTFFPGVVALPFLVLALVFGLRDRRTAFLISLLVAIPVLDLVATVGAPLQERLPFIGSFQLVRVRHLLPFAVVAVAAIGLHRLDASMRSGRPLVPRPVGVKLALGLSLTALAVGGVRVAGELVARRRALLDLDEAALGWLLAGAAFSIGAALLAVIAVGRTRIPLRRIDMVIGALLLAVALERPIYAYAERLTGADVSTWQRDLDTTPGQAFLLGQPGIDIDRVLAFGEDANRMGAVGLLHADGYQVMYPRAYHGFFGGLIGPQLGEDSDRFTYFHDWGNRAVTFGPAVDPELVALAGVRWLYVRGADVPTVPGLHPRFSEGDVTIYEVPDPLPRAFVAREIRPAPDDAIAVRELAAASVDDLRRQAWLADSTAAQPAMADRSADVLASVATIVSYAPDRVAVDVAGDAGGILVLTDAWAPGWAVTVDGADAPIHRADVAFRGVAVGPGSHHVVFRYAPAFTTAGFVVALGGVVAATAIVLVVRRGDRRRVPEAVPIANAASAP